MFKRNFIKNICEINNNMGTNSVIIAPVKNTNCIMCGKAFIKERASKLYCSPKCRQSGYYHKDKIAAIRLSQSKGISNEQVSFSLKEYKKYNQYRDLLRKYRELESEFHHVKEGSEDWNFLYKNPCCALTYQKAKIPKKIFGLKPPLLSIEQWSFIKSIYPDFKPVDFIELVCSLSSDFFYQLSLVDKENIIKANLKTEPIRNKYLFHLAKIANGEVKFLQTKQVVNY